MNEINEQKSVKLKQFGLTTLSVNNRKTVFLIAALIFIAGLSAYISMPKESFPELVIPEIYVGTPYPGGSPEFIEDKITAPFEKEFNSIKDVKEITSTSIYGYSSIKIEFNFNISIEEGRRKVQDAIADARAKPEFPSLDFEPTIREVDFSEMPVMNINLSGNYTTDDLKKYGEVLEDQIEALSEINAVDIRGIQEKKIKIELKKYEAEAMQVSFNDVINSIRSENVTMPGGEILLGGKNRSVRIEGEFQDVEEIKNIIVKSEGGENEIYLHEIANVTFGDADISSYARQFQEPVVMLDIKKRSGENLLEAADKIKKIVAERKGIPEGVDVSITNDQSSATRGMVSNLENSIIFGIILVVLVLMFFLGLKNALFVGVAIPLSMFMSFMILDSMGITLNTMVLFSLVLALGMLVDNGIVVVENVYRLMDEGYSAVNAAKYGVGEVALPIIASTATTLAAFVPLAMWPGIIGEFMKYLPLTLMIVLGSSLFIALVINPVFAAVWMSVETKVANKKRLMILAGISIGLGLLFAVAGATLLSNLLVVGGVLTFLNLFFFTPGTKRFQENALPKLENFYENFLKRAMKIPRKVLFGTIGLLIFSFVLMGLFPPKVLFFPENEPLYVNIYIETPIGTDIEVTNQITKEVEAIIDTTVYKKYKNYYNEVSFKNEEGKVIKEKKPFISSILAQVGEGTSDPASGQMAGGSTPHKARVAVQFADFEDRFDSTGKALSTQAVMEELREVLKGKFTADVSIVITKNQNGPPQDPPINIEVWGPGDYDETIEKSQVILKTLTNENVQGIEKLRLDVETGKPELLLEVDRNKAIRFGLSTQQIGSTIRTAVFGSDISTYKKGDETYDINVRLNKEKRNNIDEILDQKIAFRNNKGQLLNIPIRSVIKDSKERSTYGSVVRKDLNQVVTIYSDVTSDANGNEVVEILKKDLEKWMKSSEGKEFKADGYSFAFTGGQEQQAEEMSFLSGALGFAVFLILLVIVMQFNSYSTPTIILTAVVLSLIGVFLGLVITQHDFIIIMTMIGIISLAGVVVNNAIVLIDYTNLIRERKKEELGLNAEDWLPDNLVVESIIEGGKTRLRPVLLTAITTVLGLLPLAIGLNIDFIGLMTKYDANIYFGGDNAMFFGPMSETIIYGLTFATFLTLIFVPVMYYLLYRVKRSLYDKTDWKNEGLEEE
ncbi:MAG: efflux RND transporter permease subunit [Flavobacteriales bacterium]